MLPEAGRRSAWGFGSWRCTAGVRRSYSVFVLALCGLGVLGGQRSRRAGGIDRDDRYLPTQTRKWRAARRRASRVGASGAGLAGRAAHGSGEKTYRRVPEISSTPIVFRGAGRGKEGRVSRRTLHPVERAVGWIVGVPFASWRYVSREIEIRHEESSCDWAIDAFPEDDCRHPGRPGLLQRPSGGSGAAFRRRYRVSVERPLLSADELMSIVLAGPNVACPLEIGRFGVRSGKLANDRARRRDAGAATRRRVRVHRVPQAPGGYRRGRA
jgi:hypothetical protein